MVWILYHIDSQLQIGIIIITAEILIIIVTHFDLLTIGNFKSILLKIKLSN